MMIGRLTLAFAVGAIAPALAGAGSDGSEFAQARPHGNILLRYRIGSDGKPYFGAVKSSGYRQLDQAAKAAAEFWVLKPRKPRDMDATERKPERAA